MAKWSYGITTVSTRRETVFPQTLASLAKAGFDKPRLFIDGAVHAGAYAKYKLETTCHYPNVRTYGNWVLTLWELYIREPSAERFAIFQDDFVTCLNLRKYLEACPWKPKSYLNLYTFPQNQALAKDEGWFLSNQKGRGAVALVFDRDAVLMLLQSKHMVERPLDCKRGHRNVDGGIVTAAEKAGFKEWCHNPSLVQHTGLVTSMGSRRHPLANSFRGEDFDALTLLQQPQADVA